MRPPRMPAGTASICTATPVVAPLRSATSPPWMTSRPAGVRALTTALKQHHVDPSSYRRYAAPVYFSHGTLSHPYWLSMRDRLAALFPDFTAERYDGLHHLNTSHQAEPARVAQALRRQWSRALAVPSNN